MKGNIKGVNKRYNDTHKKKKKRLAFMIHANLMWEPCTVRYVEAKNRHVSCLTGESVQGANIIQLLLLVNLKYAECFVLQTNSLL